MATSLLEKVSKHSWIVRKFNLFVLNVIIDTFRENSTKLIDEIMVPINEAGVKFSSTHGVGS